MDSTDDCDVVPVVHESRFESMDVAQELFVEHVSTNIQGNASARSIDTVETLRINQCSHSHVHELLSFLRCWIVNEKCEVYLVHRVDSWPFRCRRDIDDWHNASLE